MSWVRPVVGLDRPDVGRDPVPESVGGREVVDARLGDGFLGHPLDVEVDVTALGVVEDLSLHIGQLGSRQIVEAELRAVTRSHSPSIESSERSYDCAALATP